MFFAAAVLACSQPAPPPPPPAEAVAPPPPAAPPIKALPLSGKADVVSRKDNIKDVPGSFSKVMGELKVEDFGTWKGADGVIRVDVASWSSGDVARDANLAQHFFGTSAFPEASFDIDEAIVPAEGIAIGAKDVAVTLKGQMSFHGKTMPATFPLLVSRPVEDGYTVVAAEPVVVDIEGWGLTAERDALMKVCGHKSIDAAVKVSVSGQIGKVPAAPAEAPPAEAAPAAPAAPAPGK